MNSPKIRKIYGCLQLSSEADSQGVVELSPAQNPEEAAYKFLREFESNISKIGRRDITLLRYALMQESETYTSKFIRERPDEGWTPGAARFRSVGAFAKPGMGGILFVLIATPSCEKISYELKTSIHIGRFVTYSLLFLDILLVPIRAFWQGDPDKRPYKENQAEGFLYDFSVRIENKKGTYLPLVTLALEQAHSSVEEEGYHSRPPAQPTSLFNTSEKRRNRGVWR